MSDPTWSALESNPETINQFLQRIGVDSLECVDVFSFDEEMLAFIPAPHLALILCFPYDEGKDVVAESYEVQKKLGRQKDQEDKVFFMHQRIHNACGTFALFHSLANLDEVVDLGKGYFRNWLDKAVDKKEDERSDLLAADGDLAAAHEQAAADGDTEQSEKVPYHFITYVSKNGNLYEIDSSSPGPRFICPTTSNTLLKDAGKAINELMEKIKSPSFAAMALVGKQ
ncbi:unnamed protein product [Auanema sp. JU1783]|nr:unnamed protein product [Auanema sp. JU1783]